MRPAGRTDVLGDLISGYSGILAASHKTGRIVVAFTSNDEIAAWTSIHQTVEGWAAEEEVQLSCRGAGDGRDAEQPRATMPDARGLRRGAVGS